MNRIDDSAMPPQQRNQIIGGKKDGGDVLIWMDTNLFAEKARVQIDMDPMVRVIQHAKGSDPAPLQPKDCQEVAFRCEAQPPMIWLRCCGGVALLSIRFMYSGRKVKSW